MYMYIIYVTSRAGEEVDGREFAAPSTLFQDPRTGQCHFFPSSCHDVADTCGNDFVSRYCRLSYSCVLRSVAECVAECVAVCVAVLNSYFQTPAGMVS